jgi:hypothetical protein
MGARFSDNDHRLSRRDLVVGTTASLICAPAVVRAASLMRVRGVLMPLGRLYWELDHPGTPYPQYGFCDRLWVRSCDQDLKAGRTESTVLFNGSRVPESKMRRIIAYARRYGFST